jgi:SH3 domain-containing YSC84-like protein 1
MNRLGIVILCAALALPLFSQKKEDQRITNATATLQQTLDSGQLPTAVLSQALCVAVFPNIKKVALGIGASYGRGVLVCRKDESPSGAWTAPLMYAVDQGSIGAQIGSTSSDIVLTFMTKSAVDRALQGKMKLGSDAAVAAGPGTSTSAYQGTADVLSYKRSSGVFAGVSLAGASVEVDKDANKSVYGKEMDAATIMSSAPIPPAAEPLVDLLNKTAPGRPRG